MQSLFFILSNGLYLNKAIACSGINVILLYNHKTGQLIGIKKKQLQFTLFKNIYINVIFNHWIGPKSIGLLKFILFILY